MFNFEKIGSDTTATDKSTKGIASKGEILDEKLNKKIKCSKINKKRFPNRKGFEFRISFNK